MTRPACDCTPKSTVARGCQPEGTLHQEHCAVLRWLFARERVFADNKPCLSIEDEEVIERARAWLSDPGAPATEPAEETASRFARVTVKLAESCIIGRSCEHHGGMAHGHEAEELRAGIEKIVKESSRRSAGAAAHKELRQSLIRLLDEVDARDSLAFLEAVDAAQREV